MKTIGFIILAIMSLQVALAVMEMTSAHPRLLFLFLNAFWVGWFGYQLFNIFLPEMIKDFRKKSWEDRMEDLMKEGVKNGKVTMGPGPQVMDPFGAMGVDFLSRDKKKVIN